jgi:hypothetical protein
MSEEIVISSILSSNPGENKSTTTFIYNPISQVGPTGSIGSTGSTGPTGPTGDVGDVGPKGLTGDKGLIGNKGSDGDIGHVGDIGPVGNIGSDGDKGPIGDIGPGNIGLDGDKGPIGNIGLDGDKGPIGAIGDTGPTGPVGNIGPTGPTGPIGVSLTKFVYKFDSNVEYNCFICCPSLQIGRNIFDGYYNTYQHNDFLVGGRDNLVEANLTYDSNGYGSFLFGGSKNTIRIGFISGGSVPTRQSSIFSGKDNFLERCNYCSIVGGRDNIAYSYRVNVYNTILGGSNNRLARKDTILTNDSGSCRYSHVFGNENLSEISTNSTILNGKNCFNDKSSFSDIFNGTKNEIDCIDTFNKGDYRFCSIMNGFNNSIKFDIIDGTRNTIINGSSGSITSCTGSYIGNGNLNKILTPSRYAFISNGENNIISGSSGSTIIGGHDNEITNGSNSVVMGHTGKIIHNNSFVWGGGTDNTVSWGDNTWTVRCPGGARFYSGAAGTTQGVKLEPNDGSWTSLSDRNAKSNLEEIKGETLINKVLNLPIYKYNYKYQNPSIKHIGVMAQDWKKAFDLGEDDNFIYDIDENGVCISLLKYLISESKKNKKQINTIKKYYNKIQNYLNIFV